MSKVAVKDYEEEALFTGNRGRSTRNDRWRRRDGGDRDQWREREEDDREERRSQLGGAQHRNGRNGKSYQSRRFDGICYNCGKKGHIARNCRSENNPVESHAVIASGALTDDEEWDMDALAGLSEEELESQTSTTIVEEEDWDFEDSTMMITEDDEWDISLSTIEETWGEEAKLSSSEERKFELLEIEEETNEECVQLPETEGDNDKAKEIQMSEVEEDFPRITHSLWHIKVDQDPTRLRQPEKILESGEDSEKSQAGRSSKTRKQNAKCVNVAIAEERRFRDADSKEESCQDTFPEKLSTSKLQKLREQLNIKRRKSVSRGSIEQDSPLTSREAEKDMKFI